MAGNREAGGFVNSTVPALFTKPPSSILPAVGTTSETVPAAGPIHGFRDFQELSQAKSWNDREP